MLDKVRNTIEKYELIKEGDRVLIGLSGGADSVCLTHALYSLKDELGITLYAAHMNHCLRGDAADSDERFSAEFAARLGIECVTERNDVRTYAEKNGISEETAGRELRYAFFKRVSKKYGLNKIATAHNKNDNAETILMHFMRGSGMTGLCGIPFKRGNIIRPIIEISRDEIEEYCADNGLSYVTDSTNGETVYTRNKIRLDLIPKIQSDFNSGFIQTVTKNAVLMADELDFIEKETDKVCENISENKIALDKLINSHAAVMRRVIMRMMKAAGVNDIMSEYIESVIELAKKGKSGASVNLSDGITTQIQYGSLIIANAKEDIPPFEYVIPIGERVFIKELNITIEAEWGEGEGVFSAGEGSRIAVRNRREGDVFCPVGMDGSKKLKNYFIDEKIPRAERSKTGVLTIDNEIAWIIGKRRDRRFLTKEKGVKINILK